jgi:hypothetical protein
MQLIGKNLHSDLPFFLSRNLFTEDINLKKDGSALQQSIINITLTNLGERPFLPDFGGSIYDMLFENFDPVNPNDDINLLGYKYRIKNSLDMYEPRIFCEDIVFSTEPTELRTVLIDVIYRESNSPASKTLRISLERTR